MTATMRPGPQRAGVAVHTPRRTRRNITANRRIICIGPRGQDILLRYLARDAESYCFRPCDSEAKRLAAVNAARVTPLSCGNRPGTNRKRRPKRSPGEWYEVASYRRAIHRACDRAFPAPEEVASDPAKLRLGRVNTAGRPTSCGTRRRPTFADSSGSRPHSMFSATPKRT